MEKWASEKWNEYDWEREIRRDERRIGCYFDLLPNCIDLPNEEDNIYSRIMSRSDLIPKGVSVNNWSGENIFSSGIPIVICLVFMLVIRWRMNILTLSDEEVHMLGRDAGWLRYAIILCATVLTACSVCISGTIGWVGLVIPHFSRMLVGPNNQRLLPLAIVLGAFFMLAVDTISRASMSAEIPLSILTGLIGAPFYFYLLLRQRLALS